MVSGVLMCDQGGLWSVVWGDGGDWPVGVFIEGSCTPITHFSTRFCEAGCFDDNDRMGGLDIG